MSNVVSNRELHKGGDRSCRHIEFDIEGSRLRYEAGDHCAVFPTNNPELVETIGRLLSVDLDAVFKLINTDGLYLINACMYYFTFKINRIVFC